MTDGITAASYVAYALSDTMVVSSVSPSTYMGELALRWNHYESNNSVGDVTDVIVLKEAEISGRTYIRYYVALPHLFYLTIMHDYLTLCFAHSQLLSASSVPKAN